MDQRFKLGSAQHAFADHLGGKLGDVAGRWKRDRSHSCRFHQLGRVIRRILKDQALRSVGDIDADRLLGVRYGVADGVGQWIGAVGIAAGRRRGRFRGG